MSPCRTAVAVKVQGDPDHPPTHGALCTKVSRYAERSYHPERVLHPLRRVGPKGSGQFERGELGRGAGRHRGAAAKPSPRATRRPSCPTATPAPWACCRARAWTARFFHRLGASLLDRTICSQRRRRRAGPPPTAASSACTWSTIAESRLILIWGSNSIASNLHFWTFAQAAKRAGAKLVCIDPRKTETADKCHQHIALLPGTDGALALGLMHELIANDWLDHDYIERHTEGWPALRERALQWPPERAAAGLRHHAPTRCAAWRATTARPSPPRSA